MVNRGFCKLTTLGEVKELLTYPDFFGDEGLITGATSKTTSTTMTLCEFMVLTTARFESFLDQFIKARIPRPPTPRPDWRVCQSALWPDRDRAPSPWALCVVR
eukprot:7378331-Prymnesium_polylepis.2